MITWLHGGVKWQIKIKTEKVSAPIIHSHPLCVTMPGRGEDRPCSSLSLNTASCSSLSFLSSRWCCWRRLLFTALLRCSSWHSLWAAMYICCWRARSASTELSSESCVSCSSDSDLFIWTADCYPWFMWIQIKCQDFTSVLYRMLDLSNLKAAPMRWRIWGGFSPGNRG